MSLDTQQQPTSQESRHPGGQAAADLHREGEALLASGRLEESILRFQEVLDLEERGETHNRLGVALARLKRTHEALDHFRRAVELLPQDPSAWTNLGNALQELGEMDEAKASYERALALDPDHPLAHHNLGALLRKQGNFSEALRHLKQGNRLERQRLREELRQNSSPRTRMMLLLLIALLLLLLLR